MLDVGCGTEALLHRARQAGHAGRLCGVDPDPASLGAARRRTDIQWDGRHGGVDGVRQRVRPGRHDRSRLPGPGRRRRHVHRNDERSGWRPVASGQARGQLAGGPPARRSGRGWDLSVGQLPAGLQNAYRQELRRAGSADPDRWAQHLQPVLAILAAAGVGPVLPIALLCAASGRLGGPEEPARVRDVLVRTPSGRRRCRPDKVYADKGMTPGVAAPISAAVESRLGSHGAGSSRRPARSAPLAGGAGPVVAELLQALADPLGSGLGAVVCVRAAGVCTHLFQPALARQHRSRP